MINIKAVLASIAVLFCGCQSYYVSGEQETYYVNQIENSIVNKFLTEVRYNDDDYTYSSVLDYSLVDTDYRKDLPNHIDFSWTNNIYSRSNPSPLYKIITVSDNKSSQYIDCVAIKDTHYSIYNLLPNVLYCISVNDIISDYSCRLLKCEEVATVGQLRMLNIDGVKIWNFRDLGGWRTKDGGHVKYGRMIRGGEVYRDDEHNYICISEYGINQLTNQLEIGVELDFGDFSSYSPLLESGVEFIHGHDYQILGYMEGLGNQDGRIKYGNCIRIVTKKLEEGKNVFFHCNAGADRTGTFAYIIEGLLGVAESDMAKDYELSSFSGYGSRLRSSREFVEMVSYIKGNFPGTTFNDKIEAFTTAPVDEGGLGVSKMDIDLLRSEMIEYATKI